MLKVSEAIVIDENFGPKAKEEEEDMPALLKENRSQIYPAKIIVHHLNEHIGHLMQFTSAPHFLTFKISPVPGLAVLWEATLVNDSLYVELPAGILPEGSKESLVTLLEYAEEKLKCKHVVCCFNKNRVDRVSLLRVFNFFGFQILPPGHPLVVSPSHDLLFMAYTIERDSGSDDSEDSDEEDEVKVGRKRSSSSECSEDGSCSDG